ncbi:hypothetical protein CTAYLR_000096 [Chrysophaeum taylorii]|uniref:Thioredoxin domain-containing protein n=1 Tax=Chrysophaeum taylorii TaxID=2483200 RepID=A0AAD7UIE1_9STRA|nr:hypothetical protein CTAYLR_000096 [Chrysophaeum taylorii]
MRKSLAVVLLVVTAAAVPSRRKIGVAVVRGGSDALKPSRSFVGRFLAAIREFLASFFDPAFGGSKAPTKQPPVKKKTYPRTTAPRRGRTVTVDDLKQLEGGEVKAVRTEEDFARFIRGNKLVVADFWASWCGPCQTMKPKFAALSDRLNRKATFLAVDVDAAKPIAQKYSVSSMPTFVFFKNGKELDRFSGADESRLESLISKLA